MHANTVVANKMRVKQIIQSIKHLGTLVFGLLAAGMLTFPAAAGAAVTNQSIAVPMYEYPTIGTFWDDITNVGGGTMPFVIVNPGNGPGAAVDATYTSEIAENTADGIRSIGYVYSSYQTRDYNEVFEDIDAWYQMYPGISGIFIDLVEDNTPEQLCYIAGLYNHVKNVHPNDLVILNPGTNISPDYEPYGDIFMNAENTYAVYQAGWTVQHPGFEDNPAYQNRFWHILHTVDPSDYADALALTRANNAGWVYITDDVMPNPYKVTPTYWNTEVSDVNALPDSVIPNRGKTQLPAGCRDLTATSSETTTASTKESTTRSAIQVTNTSATYSAEPTTMLRFTMPTGVRMTASGTDWSCDSTTGECLYGAAIPANGDTTALTADFTATCDYATGNVMAQLSNFAGNTTTFSVSLSRPADCTVAVSGSSVGDGQLADTGTPTAILSVAAAAAVSVALRVYFSRTRVRYIAVPLRHR